MKTDVLKGAFFLSSLLTYNAIIAAENLDSRVSNLENKMDQVHTKTVYGNNGARAASARPQNNGIGFYLTADLLLWKVYEGGTFAIGSVTNINNTTNTFSFTTANFDAGFSDLPEEFALALAPQSTVTAFQNVSLSYHNAHFQWDAGYRVGIGYKIPHDNWDIFANFTHFMTHGIESTPESVPQLFLNNQVSATTFYDSTNSASTTSEIRWDLHYYDITLELGKAYFISQYLSLDPHFGVRSSWIRQKMHSLFVLQASTPTSGSVLAGGPTTSNDVTTTESFGKNIFWGIGPTMGVDGNWYITRRVSVFGAISGSLLYGEYHVKLAQNEVDVQLDGSETDTFNFTIRSHPNRFAPMVQAGLGFEFTTLFNHSRMNFDLRVGYELQYWWRQNYLNDNDFISPEDLGMHGLTVQARFDF